MNQGKTKKKKRKNGKRQSVGRTNRRKEKNWCVLIVFQVIWHARLVYDPYGLLALLLLISAVQGAPLAV